MIIKIIRNLANCTLAYIFLLIIVLDMCKSFWAFF